MIRTILSPGVEIHEVDKSQYTPDVGTLPRALVFGFASKGPNKTTTEITSMSNFRTIYGTPSNEPERYFYNAVDSLIGAGATVVASKIPYSKDSRYVGVKYTVGPQSEEIKDRDIDVDAFLESYQDRDDNKDDWDPDNDLKTFSVELENSPRTEEEQKADISAGLSFIKQVDPTVLSASVIRSGGGKTSKARMGVSLSDKAFLELESGGRRDKLDDYSFIIVDKTKGIYKPFVGNGSQIDCLGILPVVTTAPNAMAIAYELPGVNMDSVDSKEISTVVNVFEPLTNLNYVKENNTDDIFEGSDSEISSFWSIGAKTYPGANTINSISKSAAEFFPTVTYSANASPTADGSVAGFDHRYFSYIGIVVYKIGVDRGSGNLVAEPIESFAGSLLANAKDVRTNASVFIEDIVNSTSNYISIYVDDKLADQADETARALFSKNSILFTEPGPGVVLGLPPVYANKSIDYETITENMENVFKSQSNILASTLDVVVDAGLSTIGQCVYGRKNPKNHLGPDGVSTLKPSEMPVSVDELLILKQVNDLENKGPWPGWRAIVNLMKKFCETTRKDCAFVCDSPRFFSLKNQRKLINPYDVSSSVANVILPKIRHISGVNTSYGWGYAVWFQIADASDGTIFWCPPSIFGANRYILTRTRWNVWDAPAGMTRGAISIDDTSFEPDLNARNTLYSNSWNYSLTDVRNGVTTLEGQKTFQSFPSAFDRINVRSLFLDVERRVFNIARNYVYEPNTADTRQRFVDNITPIFQTLKAEGGCYDYKIVADESINTPEVIDNNEFRVRIGLQPVKTIEFVLIDFVATRTGSNWSELLVDE